MLHANGTDPPDLIVISDGADGKMGDSYTRELGEGGYIDPVVLRGGSDTKKFELNSKDNYAPYLVLDPLEHDLPERDSVKFGVSLSEAPTGNVTVTFALDEVPGFGDVVNSDIVFKPSSLTFTTTNWSVPQEVTVTHTDNSTIETSGWIYVDVNPSGGGVTYDASEDFVSLNFQDNDMPTVALTASPNPVEEGEVVTITATVSEALTGDVTVPVTITAVSAETGDYTPPNPSSITITSGQTSGTLAIQTNQDVDDE